jgi:hypothetical protein
MITGVTTVRIKINRRIFVDKLQEFLSTKVHSNEERQFEAVNDLVRITYIDPLKKDWGGAKPIITFEYDEKNRYLLVITIEYAKRMAKKSLVFTANELQEKIMDELNAMVR